MWIRSLFLLGSFLLLLPLGARAASWSGNLFIEEVVVVDDLDVVRMRLSGNHNPAGCETDGWVDVRLDVPERTKSQQRQLLDAINLAFITERRVRFFVLDDTDLKPCSSIGTGGSNPVAIGIRVLN
jgi:hypothetical protein